MNVLLINGSPKGKNSNTYKLSSAFVEGIKSNSNNVIVEELQINKLELKSCIGCFSCWNKTPGKCVLKDDMGSVIDKILWADITIWSFPLYYFNVPGNLKTLIDLRFPVPDCRIFPLFFAYYSGSPFRRLFRQIDNSASVLCCT